MLKHLEGQRRGDSSNALHRHDIQKHGGDKQEYAAYIVQKEVSLLALAMREAVLIENQRSGVSMNDKNEKGRGKLVRISAERGVS